MQCVCGKEVDSGKEYCPNCGRPIINTDGRSTDNTSKSLEKLGTGTETNYISKDKSLLIAQKKRKNAEPAAQKSGIQTVVIPVAEEKNVSATADIPIKDSPNIWTDDLSNTKNNVPDHLSKPKDGADVKTTPPTYEQHPDMETSRAVTDPSAVESAITAAEPKSPPETSAASIVFQTEQQKEKTDTSEPDPQGNKTISSKTVEAKQKYPDHAIKSRTNKKRMTAWIAGIAIVIFAAVSLPFLKPVRESQNFTESENTQQSAESVDERSEVPSAGPYEGPAAAISKLSTASLKWNYCVVSFSDDIDYADIDGITLTNNNTSEHMAIKTATPGISEKSSLIIQPEGEFQENVSYTISIQPGTVHMYDGTTYDEPISGAFVSVR